MAANLRNFYFSILRLNLEKQLNGLSLQKNCVRQLRGSRSGKNSGDIRNILKLFKGFKEPVFSAETIDDDTDIEGEPTTNKISKKDMHNNLENKMTPLRNIYYPYQLEKKYKKSIGILRYLGEKLRALKVPIILGKDSLPCPVDLCVSSPLVECYRNQDEFSIGFGHDKITKTVGFLAGNIPDNQQPICLSPRDIVIIKESHKTFVKDFQNYLKDSTLAPNVRHDDGGYWHSLKIRSNVENDLMGIITIHPQDLTKEKLSEEAEKLREFYLARKPYYLKSLYLQTMGQKSSSSDSKLNLLFGDPYVVESFNNMKLKISPGSYFMSNTKALESLYASILKVCKINQSTTILDIFCGTGSLSLTVSSRVKNVLGIDNCVSSIQDAKANASNNGIQNAHFIGGNIETVLTEVLSSNFYEDLVAVINPAKTEITKTAVQCLRTCKHLKKIVYITTIPQSAVGNYVQLCRPSGTNGVFGKYFVPLFAIPVDLFPQTDRFGLVVMFQRM